jgi:hypothetical protein
MTTRKNFPNPACVTRSDIRDTSPSWSEDAGDYSPLPRLEQWTTNRISSVSSAPQHPTAMMTPGKAHSVSERTPMRNPARSVHRSRLSIVLAPLHKHRTRGCHHDRRSMSGRGTALFL